MLIIKETDNEVYK